MFSALFQKNLLVLFFKFIFAYHELLKQQQLVVAQKLFRGTLMLLSCCKQYISEPR